MSALGHKQTLAACLIMSAVGGQADSMTAAPDFRCQPYAVVKHTALDQISTNGLKGPISQYYGCHRKMACSWKRHSDIGLRGFVFPRPHHLIV